MPRGDRVSQYLLGVADLNVYSTIGSSQGDQTNRERRHITRASLRELTDCPGGCHGGGFELARDLHDRLFSRSRPEGDGFVRCRGYLDASGGRRVSCDHTLLYRARVAYDARYY